MQISPQLRLQDVIFASLYAIFPALDDENRVLRVWIQRYKDLLNSIQFFVPRAKFEKMVRKLLEPYKGDTPKESKPTPSLYKEKFLASFFKTISSIFSPLKFCVRKWDCGLFEIAYFIWPHYIYCAWSK